MDKLHTASKSLIRDINTSTILQIVRERGPISRADISKITRLNPATVSSNIANLIQLGVVKEVGSGLSSGGRKPMLVELNASAFHVIGVDMGTTEVTAALTDLEGRLLQKVTLPFEASFSHSEVLETMKASVRRVIEASQTDHDKLLGIGIGVHGLVDTEQGISIFAPAFQWENIPISEMFGEEFGLPVKIDNDVRAMALGEKWFGKATDAASFIFLNIGTGIGSGIYLNGSLLRGAHYGAGEIGHIQMVEGGERCFCGKTGCLSTLASGPAMEARARRRLRQGAASLLSETFKDNLESLNGKHIYEAAVRGDRLAAQILDETGRYLGHAISIMINLLNPELVLLGGGVTGGGEFLLRGLREAMVEKAMNNNVEKVRIEMTGLGDDCGVIGAATLILKDIFNNPNKYN